MTRKTICLAIITGALFHLYGCSSAAIKASDGSTVSGSMLNGQISYSHGAACAQVEPNPGTPIPVSSSPTAMTIKQVCDGNNENCVKFLAQDDAAPTCVTQTATVRGTDLTTYFGWGLAAAATFLLKY